jgi:serine phosphatase RsbU (regulator of sigma subunit)
MCIRDSPDIATRGVAFADGAIWLAKGQSLFVIDKSKLAFRYGAFRTVFTRITSGKNHVILDGTFCSISRDGVRIQSPVQPEKPAIVLKHSENSISFGWTTTSYVEEAKTEYRYRLMGFDDEWSGWENRTYRDYTNLPSGDYRFLLRAKTITGLEGEEMAFSFSVSRPWYISAVALIAYGIVAVVVLSVLITGMIRRLRRRSRRLEYLLRQRNEATMKGRSEITGMEKYAGMVQRALLPSDKRLGEAVKNSFLLNRPMGAVSGDFFWVKHLRDRTIMAVGDCTGHGVESSLRTIMAMSFLDEIADGRAKLTTSEMLGEFRNMISQTFTGVSPRDMHLEGVDLSLLVIDRASGTVQFSGAATQCFRVRVMSDQEKAKWDNGEFRPNEGTMASGKYLLETVYGDRIPLGMHLDGDHVFTQHTWKLEKESSYYLFTDGYPDQFNGSTGKKFLKRNLRRLILDIQNFHMGKQKEILEERLGSWMGQAPQTDDILMVGLRIE